MHQARNDGVDPLEMEVNADPWAAFPARPRLTAHPTNRFTSKMWLTPEGEFMPLQSFHYEYFRDPAVSSKYGVAFRDEVQTRLEALRVGFVRINYERNRGFLTIESMRWDRALRNLLDSFIVANAEDIDHIRLHMLDEKGVATGVGYVSLFDLHRSGTPINRLSLGSWNSFRPIHLPRHSVHAIPKKPGLAPPQIPPG